ncbi:hypothetical protein ABGB07_36440 [Micromonosporaceae bacterium B7E4]
MLAVVILSFGYLVLREVLRLVILLAGGGHTTAVEVLVLRHQVRPESSHRMARPSLRAARSRASNMRIVTR